MVNLNDASLWHLLHDSFLTFCEYRYPPLYMLAKIHDIKTAGNTVNCFVLIDIIIILFVSVLSLYCRACRNVSIFLSIIVKYVSPLAISSSVNTLKL